MRNIFVSILFFSTLLLSFTNSGDQNTVILLNAPLQNIERQYHQNLDELIQAAQQLELDSKAYLNGSIDAKALQKSISQTRMTFKKVEYIFDFLDPETITKYINGAPLPKLMPGVPEIVINDPNGLQTLDEMIYLDPESNKAEIVKLAAKIRNDLQKSIPFQKRIKLQHRMVFEASRYSILRIFTLGVTGFDTPGSVNAIEEAQISLNQLNYVFKEYLALTVQKSEASQLNMELLTVIGNGIQYLAQHDDFDSFDRAQFYKNYVKPIYSKIYSLQKALNIETSQETDPTLSPHNYESTHIFDHTFFNPAYYTGIAESDLFDPKKITLGKYLFYDPILSKDLTMSCASCHNPQKGFTDGLAKSNSNKPGKTTSRNSPTILNSALYGRYFWDMREYSLERQVKHVVSDRLEFNMDFIELAERLKESKEYSQLFEEAYGDRDKYGISTWSISNALAAYVTSLSSFNSKFDQYMRGQIEQIDQSVIDGFNVFMGKGGCGTCHFAPSFSGLVPPFYKDSESEVLGITTTFDTINPILDDDPGRIANGMPQEEAPFYHRSIKTATVRNTELTAPYMHNGAFATLEEVMHFYNHGGGAGLGLSIENQTLPDSKLNLSKQEINNVISFLNALTDTVGMTSIPTSLPKFEQQEQWNQRLSY